MFSTSRSRPPSSASSAKEAAGWESTPPPTPDTTGRSTAISSAARGSAHTRRSNRRGSRPARPVLVAATGRRASSSETNGTTSARIPQTPVPRCCSHSTRRATNPAPMRWATIIRSPGGASSMLAVPGTPGSDIASRPSPRPASAVISPRASAGRRTFPPATAITIDTPARQKFVARSRSPSAAPTRATAFPPTSASTKHSRSTRSSKPSPTVLVKRAGGQAVARCIVSAKPTCYSCGHWLFGESSPLPFSWCLSRSHNQAH